MTDATADSLVSLALDHLDAGRADLARRELERAVAIDPTSARAHAGLALALARLRLLDAAEQEAQHALRLDPELAFAHASLGLVLGELGARRRAIAELEEAVRLDPDAVYLYGLLSSMHLAAGRDRDAEAVARRGLAVDPTHQDCLNSLAASLLSRGRPDEAAAIFREALRVAPQDALLHANLSVAGFRGGGRLADAREGMREAVRLDPAHALLVDQFETVEQAETDGMVKSMLRFGRWWRGMRRAKRVSLMLALVLVILVIRPLVLPGLLAWWVLSLYIGTSAATWLEQRLELDYRSRHRPTLRRFVTPHGLDAVCILVLALVGLVLAVLPWPT